jgi:DNA-3-methyladenine glycosylase II
MTTILTTDHPAWYEAENGARTRAVRAGSGVWVVTLDRDGLDMTCVHGDEDRKPALAFTDPAALPAAVPAALRDGLSALGATHRLTNPWLWDAITTAILRQVVRAEQARKLYRKWCEHYGTVVEGPHGKLTVAPTPEQVLELADHQFADIGAKFHRSALQAAAENYEKHGLHWLDMNVDDLTAALVNIPRIGPWTAAAAACDYTGDFSIYPHDDLAVRTWAARIAPSYPWPGKKDKGFGPLWTGWAGTDRTALHTLTLSTLTWGSHARADLEDPCGT